MILAAGPYVGSFEEEIITFLPYVKWLYKAISPDELYVSTHFNRLFLYDFDNVNCMPIYKHITRDELGQVGVCHKDVSFRDYNLMVRNFISSIGENDIRIESLEYSKSPRPYTIHNKLFETIDMKEIDIPDEWKNRLVFLPYGDKRQNLAYIYDNLIKNYDVIVIGDMKCELQEYNILSKRLDYFENVWKYIIGVISYAKLVICPGSYMTVIANLQKSPVFSWCSNPGQFRDGGIYHLGNDKCRTIPMCEGKHIVEFLRRLLNDEI